MANYNSCSRTNYFRVTDEAKYKKLFKKLTSDGEVEDLSKEENNGVLYHAFGAFGSVDYIIQSKDNDDYEYDFDFFLKEIQKILPEKEAFIYMESGHEKLRYVVGFAIIVTKDKIETVNIQRDALDKAREMLGDIEFNSELSY